MRGKPSAGAHGFDLRRNIPAYAGKTSEVTMSAIGYAEHPRVCGENLLLALMLTWGLGTSPRMRGKRLRFTNLLQQRRNIPAYAGKTVVLFRHLGIDAEHPRVCGENGLPPIHPLTCLGTSPRMRGKRMCCSQPWTACGNIPAYAGKTRLRLTLK